MDELSNKISNELHHQVTRNFTRRKVIALHTDQIWAMDLIDMVEYAKQNNGEKYILCIIDVFSKYAWCIPLADKTAATVLKAFKSVIKSSKRQPEKIWSDKGSEFYNELFKAYLNKNDITQYSTYGESKSVVVERFNRTIKTWLWKYFTAKHTRNWVDTLEDLTDFYNRRKHRSIKMTPTEASKPENHEKAFSNLYSQYYSKEMNEEAPIPKFRVGDVVRISRMKDTFEHGFHDNYSRETFTISKINKTNPITYNLKEHNGHDIEGSFYTQELLKTSEPDFYEVEEVLKTRKLKNGKTQHFVKYLGWPKKYNAWLDAENIRDIH